ncbi:unnamed protein product [Malus baccata var. baccata]
MPSPIFVSVLATKLFALKTGLDLAINAVWFPLTVESDSHNSIHLISLDELCPAPEGGYVEMVRLLSQDRHLIMQASSRHANRAAHRITRHGLHNQGFDFWTDVCPPWLADILLSKSITT